MNVQNVKKMLMLQSSMNEKVNPLWKGAGYNWMRAAMIEGVEGMDHHGWKWWKKQEPNWPQLQMELVDIWHFGLSHLIIQNPDLELDEIAVAIYDEIKLPVGSLNIGSGQSIDLNASTLLDKLQFFVGMSAFNEYSIPLFSSIIHDAKMSWDMLYQQYIGKNVLNFFRQDHGYKDGTYVKTWNGLEDNEHLNQIMIELSTDDNLAENLYRELKSRYMKLVESKVMPRH